MRDAQGSRAPMQDARGSCERGLRARRHRARHRDVHRLVRRAARIGRDVRRGDGSRVRGRRGRVDHRVSVRDGPRRTHGRDGRHRQGRRARRSDQGRRRRSNARATSTPSCSTRPARSPRAARRSPTCRSLRGSISRTTRSSPPWRRSNDRANTRWRTRSCATRRDRGYRDACGRAIRVHSRWRCAWPRGRPRGDRRHRVVLERPRHRRGRDAR